MRKVITGLIIIVLIAAGIFFYSSRRTNAKSVSSGPSGSSGSNSQPQAQIGQNTITIKNFSFSPDTLTVKKGTTVTWINQDSVAHKIKSNTFNSNNLNQGDMFRFTFSNTGTYNYSCGIHPSMTGKVVVE